MPPHDCHLHVGSSPDHLPPHLCSPNDILIYISIYTCIYRYISRSRSGGPVWLWLSFGSRMAVNNSASSKKTNKEKAQTISPLCLTDGVAHWGTKATNQPITHWGLTFWSFSWGREISLQLKVCFTVETEICLLFTTVELFFLKMLRCETNRRPSESSYLCGFTFWDFKSLPVPMIPVIRGCGLSRSPYSLIFSFSLLSLHMKSPCF